MGGVKAESSGNIYFPYQFLHGESSNTRTHTHTHDWAGSTAKFKARITRISEIFYRTRPKDTAVIRTYMYIAMR